jgi:hypothetical protein
MGRPFPNPNSVDLFNAFSPSARKESPFEEDMFYTHIYKSFDCEVNITFRKREDK